MSQKLPFTQVMEPYLDAYSNNRGYDDTDYIISTTVTPGEAYILTSP